MRHGSLFSGIGGFDLAAEWMGWDNVFHCEWNQFGQQVLKYYWPNAISYDDICKTDFTIHRGHIDILTGGFPCQPFSLAGKRKGTEDSRHLWPEMLRAIRECKPTWIVGENVPGLINWSGGLVFEQVCADLEGEGYEVQPVVLPACGVNAPHRRDRVWIVAYLSGQRINGINGDNNEQTGENWKRNDEFDSDRSIRPTKNPNEDGRARADNDETWDAANSYCNKRSKGRMHKEGRKEAERYACTRNAQSHRRADWQDFPTVAPLCNGNDGISSRLDSITFPKWRNESIKAGGNAIVPQVAYQIFKVIETMSA